MVRKKKLFRCTDNQLVYYERREVSDYGAHPSFVFGSAITTTVGIIDFLAFILMTYSYEIKQKNILHNEAGLHQIF